MSVYCHMGQETALIPNRSEIIGYTFNEETMYYKVHLTNIANSVHS